MDRRRLLLLVALAMMITLPGATPSWAGINGNGAQDAQGSGGTVKLFWTTPGTPGSPGSDGGAGGSDEAPSPTRIPCVKIYAGKPCRTLPKAPRPAVPGAPGIADLATFQVEAPEAMSQPNGWAVIGRPTNFYATGGVHEVAGTLLGRPAIVRFTPIAWNWDYGDRTTATTDTGGRRWPEGGEFAATPTSHVYEGHDDYVVRLVVEYRAEYSFDGQPWRPVNGTLTVPANELTIRTWYVQTRLVSTDCLQDPRGIGCDPERDRERDRR